MEQELIKRLERIERLTLIAAKDALTTKEAATYLGMSVDYLYTLVSEKKIPYYKGGGGKLNYFAKSELNTWMLKYRVKTAEEQESIAAAYCINNPRERRQR